MAGYDGYFGKLESWASTFSGFTLETADNGATAFVTLRREGGTSWTGSATYATPNAEAPNAEAAKDKAALSAANLYKVRRR